MNRRLLRDGHRRAEAPAQPVGQIDVVGIAAEDEAAVARHLDPLVDFLADDPVDREVRLARCRRPLSVLAVGSLIIPRTANAAGCCFHCDIRLIFAPTQKSPSWLPLHPCRTSGASFTTPPAYGLRRDEQRPHVAIDPAHHRPRAENLRPVAGARRRTSPASSTRRVNPWSSIEIHPVRAQRPLLGRQHLARRHDTTSPCPQWSSSSPDASRSAAAWRSAVEGLRGRATERTQAHLPRTGAAPSALMSRRISSASPTTSTESSVTLEPSERQRGPKAKSSLEAQTKCRGLHAVLRGLANTHATRMLMRVERQHRALPSGTATRRRCRG